MLIVEQDLVRVSDLEGRPRSTAFRPRAWPKSWATHGAEIVMVGFFAAVTKLLTATRCAKPWPIRCRASFRELNLKAFEKGFEYGNAELAAAPAGGAARASPIRASK